MTFGSTFALVLGLILMAFLFSMVLNGIIPFVLELVPEKRTGLGLGIYFGAFGGAISFFDLFFKGMNNLDLQTSLGAISLIVAALFVALGWKIRLYRTYCVEFPSKPDL